MKPSLTVACVFVQGNVDYTPHYVANLRSMVARNLSTPHRFVCLTDRPVTVENIEGVEPIRISTMPGPGWWSKLRYFDEMTGLEGRVLCLDLDLVVIRPLDEIVRRRSPFSVVPHAGTFNGRNGLRVVKKYNTSVMYFPRIEDYRWLFSEFHTSLVRELWGDQDYIGQVVADAATMPIEWFPRLSEVRQPPWPLEAKVILAKKPKPHEAADELPWFREFWR